MITYEQFSIQGLGQNGSNFFLMNPPFGIDETGERLETKFINQALDRMQAQDQATVIVPNGLLSRKGEDMRLRIRLIEEFDLQRIVQLPLSVFAGTAQVHTSILYFAKNKGKGFTEVYDFRNTSDMQALVYTDRNGSPTYILDHSIVRLHNYSLNPNDYPNPSAITFSSEEALLSHWNALLSQARQMCDSGGDVQLCLFEPVKPPADIFVVDDINYEICIQKGLAGIFKLDSKQTNELILSHMLLLREGDPLLFYIKGKQELQGIWQVVGAPFYDTTQVWQDRLYPYRVCIQAVKDHVFGNPLKLSDIYLLRDAGHVWNFHLMRNQRSPNAIIEITNVEFDAIYNEFLKINPGGGVRVETTPSRTYSGSSLLEQLSFQTSRRGIISPQYEFTIMALLAKDLSKRNTIQAFSGCSDYIAYIQTDWGKEIDALLTYEHPFKKGQITSYDLIEVKKDRFGEDGLVQLLNYEAWFTQKRASGDRNMVRSIAIAKSFHPEVIRYLEKRKKYENKQMLLFKYSIPKPCTLQLDQIG